MKGKTLVIGILLFVVFVVGFVIFAMMSTINGIKKDLNKEETSAIIIEYDVVGPEIELN